MALHIRLARILQIVIPPPHPPAKSCIGKSIVAGGHCGGRTTEDAAFGGNFAAKSCGVFNLLCCSPPIVRMPIVHVHVIGHNHV